MTSATNPKVIELYGMGLQLEEIVTDAAITPGMLVTRTATGIRPHNVASGVASPQFAIENGAVGKGIDDDYAIGDQCIFKAFAVGSAVYALAHAGGAAIAAGAMLMSAGDGTLELASTDDTAIAQALEAIDNSGGATPVRIRVEVIPAQRTAPA